MTNFLYWDFFVDAKKYFPRRVSSGQKKISRFEEVSPQEIQKILEKAKGHYQTQKGHKFWAEKSVCLIHSQTLK